MKYETIKEYGEGKFRRITGIKRETYHRMVEILKRAYTVKHKRKGQHAKLSIEDMLLAALEYLREYRTYAHIAASYGIAESNMHRTIKWVGKNLPHLRKNRSEPMPFYDLNEKFCPLGILCRFSTPPANQLRHMT